MKAMSTGLALLAIAVVGGTLSVTPVSAQNPADPPNRWEYRVLTKGELLDLGKKDLAAGLNKLGDDGWELTIVDSASTFIFKRQKGLDRQQVKAIKERIAVAESEVAQWKERMVWETRMAKKGYMTQTQVEADQAKLQAAELILDKARKELGTPPADPNAPENLPKPKK